MVDLTLIDHEVLFPFAIRVCKVVEPDTTLYGSEPYDQAEPPISNEAITAIATITIVSSNVTFQ